MITRRQTISKAIQYVSQIESEMCFGIGQDLINRGPSLILVLQPNTLFAVSSGFSRQVSLIHGLKRLLQLFILSEYEGYSLHGAQTALQISGDGLRGQITSLLFLAN